MKVHKKLHIYSKPLLVEKKNVYEKTNFFSKPIFFQVQNLFSNRYMFSLGPFSLSNLFLPPFQQFVHVPQVIMHVKTSKCIQFQITSTAIFISKDVFQQVLSLWGIWKKCYPSCMKGCAIFCPSLDAIEGN